MKYFLILFCIGFIVTIEGQNKPDELIYTLKQQKIKNIKDVKVDNKIVLSYDKKGKLLEENDEFRKYYFYYGNELYKIKTIGYGKISYSIKESYFDSIKEFSLINDTINSIEIFNCENNVVKKFRFIKSHFESVEKYYYSNTQLDSSVEYYCDHSFFKQLHLAQYLAQHENEKESSYSFFDKNGLISKQERYLNKKFYNKYLYPLQRFFVPFYLIVL